MYNPFSRWHRATSEQARSAANTVHPALSAYEILSYLLIFPAFFTSGVGFLLVAFNVYIAQESSKSDIFMPLVLAFFVNFLLVPLTFAATENWQNPLWVVLAFCVPASLWLTGTTGVILHYRKS